MEPIQTIVIAAAGKGTRMQEFSADKPKHLVPIGGKPFLYYVLVGVQRAGFSRVVVVVGHKGEQIREFLSGQDYGAMNVEVIDQFQNVRGKYGTAVVVEAVEGVLAGQPFVYQNGDSLFSQKAYEQVRANDGYTHVLGTYHEDPTSYGVLEADAQFFLKQIVEKPKQPICHSINVGLYAFQPDIFSAVRQVSVSERGEYELTDAINVLARERRVTVSNYEGNEYVDFGKPEDLATVERFIAHHQYV